MPSSLKQYMRPCSNQEYITLKQRSVQLHTCPRISKYILAWVGYMATKVSKLGIAVYQLPAAIPDEFQHF